MALLPPCMPVDRGGNGVATSSRLRGSGTFVPVEERIAVIADDVDVPEVLRKRRIGCGRHLVVTVAVDAFVRVCDPGEDGDHGNQAPIDAQTIVVDGQRVPGIPRKRVAATPRSEITK